MIRWIGLSMLFGSIITLPAVAQAPTAAPDDAFLYTAQTVLLLLGLAFTGYWAYEAFNAPPIRLGDGPTLPRYMTQPGQYRLGSLAFVGICLIAYSLIAYFHTQFFPLVGVISRPLQKAIETSTTNGSLPYPLVVVFAAAIFVASLKFERDWNPVLVLRRVLHTWISIPKLANALMVMARDELVVPADARAALAADAGETFVAIEDFTKGARTLDRGWAELCYIRSWLEQFRAMGSHLTFFSEPSFAWEQLQTEYDHVRNLIAPLKRGDIADTGLFAEVAARVDALRRQYCRLAACFLVFKNETSKSALADAKSFGVTITAEFKRTNPLRYIAIFMVAIMAGIYVGVTLSAIGWDLLHGNVATAFIQDPNLLTRWLGYALANYGTAITAVLFLRYLGWTVDASQPNSYLVSYASVFLVALCAAALCLSLAIMLAGASPTADLPYPRIVYTTFKWSVSPAIVAVFVAYHVDRQIDPLLPDIGSSENWGVPQRLTSCVFFSLIVTVFAALPAMAIVPNPNPTLNWPVGKVQLVIVGTTFVVGLVMAVAGEFFLIKPAPAAALRPNVHA